MTNPMSFMIHNFNLDSDHGIDRDTYEESMQAISLSQSRDGSSYVKAGGSLSQLKGDINTALASIRDYLNSFPEGVIGETVFTRTSDSIRGMIYGKSKNYALEIYLTQEYIKPESEELAPLENQELSHIRSACLG